LAQVPEHGRRARRRETRARGNIVARAKLVIEGVEDLIAEP
jgi:hypothetical protein